MWWKLIYIPFCTGTQVWLDNGPQNLCFPQFPRELVTLPWEAVCSDKMRVSFPNSRRGRIEYVISFVRVGSYSCYLPRLLWSFIVMAKYLPIDQTSKFQLCPHCSTYSRKRWLIDMSCYTSQQKQYFQIAFSKKSLSVTRCHILPWIMHVWNLAGSNKDWACSPSSVKSLTLIFSCQLCNHWHFLNNAISTESKLFKIWVSIIKAIHFASLYRCFTT